MDLADRLNDLYLRVAAACERSGRRADEVSIIAVSKTYGPERIAEAAAAGITVFGENRVQEARQKIPLCAGNLEWHMIGHLQRNKARQAVDLFETIHSIDSLQLLETVDSICAEKGKTMPVNLEVNVSGERSKYGMAPEDVREVLVRSLELMSVEVIGLMTIPPFAEDPGKSRPFFRELRELRNRMRADTGVPLDELSMGMSNDFEIAVEEGATCIRIGSLLFGQRK